MKKVIVQFNIPGMTVEQYEQAWKDLLGVGQSSPTGLIQHAGGNEGDNWVVVEIWQSEKAFNKYNEILLPVLVNLGINITELKPVVTPVHYEYEAAELPLAF